MKKTRRIIMGITALVVAFSACAFTACSSNSTNESNNDPDEGTISGNYQEASAEEVNTALSTVDQDKIFGDTTAEDYRFGIEITSDFDLSLTTATKTQSVQLSAGYQLLATAGESEFSFKGAGNLTMNSTATAEGKTTTDETTLSLWQDDAVTYASMTTKSSANEEGTEPKPTKIKINVSELVKSLLPSIEDSTITDLPAEIELPEGINTPEVSSMDLISAINTLNEMGATVAMDLTNGIKLKISFSEQTIINLIAKVQNTTAEEAAELISFVNCGLDLYLSLDKNGTINAASVVADLEATYTPSDAEESATTIKLGGYLYFAVDADVTPEIPESLKTDSFLDLTTIIPIMIGGYIGNVGITG